jgi:hypothetical protein
LGTLDLIRRLMADKKFDDFNIRHLRNVKQCMNVNLNFSTSILAGYGIDHIDHVA